MNKFGLVLGSGGARGLAHIVILEAFDELGIKPSIIAGSSIGALIGAAYCAGLSAKEIKERFNELMHSEPARILSFYKNSEYLNLLEYIDLGVKQGGLIKGEKFMAYYSEVLGVKTFEELKIPLKVVTTNYFTREQSIFDSGELFAPIKASYSVPGLFPPVLINKNYYADGGMVNPVPYDIIEHLADYVIAVNIAPPPSKPNKEETPPIFETLFASFQIMQVSILNAKLKISQPDLLINPKIENVRMLEFVKSKHILKSAEETKEQVKRFIDKRIK
jgi:NTE family protein